MAIVIGIQSTATRMFAHPGEGLDGTVTVLTGPAVTHDGACAPMAAQPMTALDTTIAAIHLPVIGNHDPITKAHPR